jgi:hypothetical protein
MGLFSWKTQDTDRSIPCNGSSRPTFKVVMTDNKGNKWIEEDYEGYGVFGGKDFYELLAEINGKTTRDAGIDLAFGKEPFISPNLNEDESIEWTNKEPDSCEYQGYFYDDEDERCDWCGSEMDLGGCAECDD